MQILDPTTHALEQGSSILPTIQEKELEVQVEGTLITPLPLQNDIALLDTTPAQDTPQQDGDEQREGLTGESAV